MGIKDTKHHSTVAHNWTDGIRGQQAGKQWLPQYLVFRRFGTQGRYEMVWMGAGDLSLLIEVVYTHYLYYCRPG